MVECGLEPHVLNAKVLLMTFDASLCFSERIGSTHQRGRPDQNDQELQCCNRPIDVQGPTPGREYVNARIADQHDERQVLNGAVSDYAFHTIDHADTFVRTCVRFRQLRAQQWTVAIRLAEGSFDIWFTYENFAAAVEQQHRGVAVAD